MSPNFDPRYRRHNDYQVLPDDKPIKERFDPTLPKIPRKPTKEERKPEKKEEKKEERKEK